MKTASTEPGLLHRLRVPLVVLVVLVVAGFVGYTALGFDPLDALYLTVSVLTTIGFNPDKPFTASGKVFTVALAVMGIALFLAALAIVTSALTEARGQRARRRRMEKRIASLGDHFIVCAYGRVGRAAARELQSEGVPFVVIDKQDELEEDLRSDGVVYLIEDPTSEEVLLRAGVERARGIICAVDDDAINVFITIMSRSMNPKLFIVARASAAESPEVLRRAGADRVISPYVSSGGHMARLAMFPRIVDYLEVAGPPERRLRLEELMIEGGSPLIGRTLADATGGAIPVLLRTSSGEVIPGPPTDRTLEHGDVLLMVGEPEDLQRVEKA